MTMRLHGRNGHRMIMTDGTIVVQQAAGVRRVLILESWTFDVSLADRAKIPNSHQRSWSINFCCQ